jgi:NAD(P)-dependent dehydrogenase (short-subunit alcohol dehydrogenase family)
MKNYSEASSIKKQPAETKAMEKKPVTFIAGKQDIYRKLRNKVAIITGGDSGIGQAVALLYAQHGINLVIVYFSEDNDANFTKTQAETLGVKCLIIKGDISQPEFCKKIVEKTIDTFGRIDFLINNAAVQYPQEDISNITPEQLYQTFGVNIYGMFFLTIEALKYLKKGSSIINTSSVTAFRGSEHLVDYAATKAAIVGFTRSLAAQLAKKKISVNAVAPGPVITPLIPASFDKDHVKKFGKDTPMGRPGQPYEIAPSYLFLILESNSYMTGQILHPNGGEIVA